jgi:hypothetical protein
MERHGYVNEIKEDTWSPIYCYRVGNGVRIVMMDIKEDIPSQLYVAAIQH